MRRLIGADFSSKIVICQAKRFVDMHFFSAKMVSSRAKGTTMYKIEIFGDYDDVTDVCSADTMEEAIGIIQGIVHNGETGTDRIKLYKQLELTFNIGITVKAE